MNDSQQVRSLKPHPPPSAEAPPATSPAKPALPDPSTPPAPPPSWQHPSPVFRSPSCRKEHRSWYVLHEKGQISTRQSTGSRRQHATSRGWQGRGCSWAKPTKKSTTTPMPSSLTRSISRFFRRRGRGESAKTHRLARRKSRPQASHSETARTDGALDDFSIVLQDPQVANRGKRNRDQCAAIAGARENLERGRSARNVFLRCGIRRSAPAIRKRPREGDASRGASRGRG